MASKILLVEDDPDFSAVFALALELQGHLVCQVPSGYLAIDYLSNERPDLIISDLEMNGIDGRALCKHIRRISDWSAIPFIILSAYVDPEEPGSLDDLPVDRFLSKQIPISELVRLVGELLTSTDGKPRSKLS